MELAFRGRYHWTMFLSGGIWDTGIFQKGTETKTNCIRDAVIIGFLPNEFYPSWRMLDLWNCLFRPFL